MDLYSNINEIITLENEKLKVEVLPELGGKISNFTMKDTDFNVVANNEDRVYFIPEKDTPFAESDASGFDDTFPNIDVDNIVYNSKQITYYDHGEIWRSKFKVIDKTNTMVKMEFISDEYNYKYIKIISIKENKMNLNIDIQKLDKEELPCLWTWHGLVKYQEDMKLLYPKGIKKILNVCDSKELGEDGKIHDINSNEYDFYSIPHYKSNTAIKYYINDKIEEGYCGYEYPSQHTKLEIEYDAKKLPYLGFWATVGKFRGNYNCAFEPSNGFYDGIKTAMDNNKYFILSETNSLEFELIFTLSKI